MIWLDAITEILPGPTRLRVRGQSMLPTLRPGDEVLVQPVTAEALAPGDWVALRGGFLHRYLGWRKGRLVTKGDGHRALDPAWPPDAVLGRVVEAQRAGQCFYCRTPGQLRRERLLAAGHRAFGDVWGALRRVKALFLAVFALLLVASLVWAAVTITSFTAQVGATSITLKWETASETSNLGFFLFRSQTEGSGYTDISGFIESLDQGAGAQYSFEDNNVTPGVIYYYKLQDVPAGGGTSTYIAPISATIPISGTLTPTPTPTLTPTPGPTSSTATITPTATATGTPAPTATLNPNVRFWADKTDVPAGECATLQWQTRNVRAVYFDNVGVPGDGARTFCPCAAESHTLNVKYQDGTTEDFVITLNVTGVCATPRAGTPTLTSTPRLILPPNESPATATFTLAPGATARPPVIAPSPATLTPTPPLPTPAPLDTPLPSPTWSLPLSPLATPRLASTRALVEGDSRVVKADKALSIWLVVVGGIVGLGFMGAGVLMWKRRP